MRVVIGRSVIQHGGWEKEKKDIFGRLDWLCERIIVESEAFFLGELAIVGEAVVLAMRTHKNN